MAKKGSAQATIGLDFSAFEAGGKAVMKIAQQMGSFIRDTLAVAAGNILASAFTKGASALASFAGAMKDNLLQIFMTGEELANMAHATGMATGQYLQFKTAVEKGVTFSEAGKLLGKNAEIMERDANIFRDISLKLFAVGERIKGFWLGVADQIAPVINPLLDRLAALDLSAWGQAFAEPIAKAVGIIYQLAVDGQLWQTMGELAAAAFKYASEILGKCIALFASMGFEEALSTIWESIKSIGVYLYETLQSAFGRVIEFFSLGFLAALNKAADLLDSMAVMMGFLDESTANDMKKDRDSTLEGVAAGYAEPSETPKEEKASLAESLKDIFKSVTFGTPEMWAKIEEAGKKFEGVAKNSKNNEGFSNQSFSQNFGVSSLASVGGGGGTGAGSLIGHAEQQTKIQQETLDNVRIIAAWGNAQPIKSPGPSSLGNVTIK